MAYIILEWIGLIKILINIVHINNYYNKRMSKQLFKYLNPINRFPFSIIKLTLLGVLGLDVYFVTIFIPLSNGCDIYKDHHDACLSMQIISVFGIFVLSIIALTLGLNILLILLTCLCSPNDGCHLIGDFCKTISEILSMCCCTCYGTSPQIQPQNIAHNQNSQNQLLNSLNRHLTSYLPISSTPPSDGICAICAADAILGDTWKQLPCKHKFHPQCVDPWITENNSCPLCRQPTQLLSV